MKLTAITKNLRSAIDRVHQIPGTVSPAGLLVKLTAGMAGLEITRRTDVSALVVDCDCEVEEEGEMVVGIGDLSNIIKSVTGESVTLKSDGVNLVLSSGRMLSEIAMAGDEQFLPFTKSEAPSQDWMFLIEDFLSWLHTGGTYPSHDATRSNLNGLIFDSHNDTLLISSSNGTCVSSCNTHEKATLESMILVPNGCIGAIKKVFGNSKGKAQIQLTKDTIRVVADGADFVSALSCEKPPDYKMIIKQETKIGATVDRETFTKAVKAGAPLCGERQLMVFTPGVKSLTLYGRSGQLDFTDEIEAEIFKDHAKEFILPADQLILALDRCTEKTINLEQNDHIFVIRQPGKYFAMCKSRVEIKRKKK